VAAERPQRILVTGPASGGKSRWAEHLARRDGRPVHYLATGPLLPEDADWQRRLHRHRGRRPQAWRTVETGERLSECLTALGPGELALVDSLGTWVASHLEAGEGEWEGRCKELLGALGRSPADLLLVAEETGWGLVPPTAAGGRFRERLGTLLQRVLPCCDAAWLVVHGRAIDLVALGQPVPGDP
jgi:adenosylcobinamide kinase/adenosylcobinamide-phosphate guanylyltransferase